MHTALKGLDDGDEAILGLLAQGADVGGGVVLKR